MIQDIEKRFTYHPPTPAMVPKFPQLRDKAKELAYLIDALMPSMAGRERALALTALEEVVMWANAGIARNPE